MPLIKSTSKQALAENIAELHRANKGKSKPRSNAQIAAIAYATQREARKK